MRTSSRRGSVMVHVLVTSVVAMVVAAGLLRLVMMRYVTIQRMQDGGAGTRKAEAAVAAVTRHWNQNGSCTTPPNFSAVVSAAPCGCVLAGSGDFAGVRVESVAGAAGGACGVKFCTDLANPSSQSCP